MMRKPSFFETKSILFWGAALFVAVLALVFCWRFRYAVFAGDMGVKYLQALTFQSGPLELDYPAKKFDPLGQAFPFEPPVVFQSPKGWISVWLNPMVLFLVPLFDRVFGWAGYLMPPFLGGLLSVYGLRFLGRELHLPSPNVAAPLVWLLTPLLFYSLILWEHTLAVGCGLMAVASLLHSIRKREASHRAGFWLGAAALFRAEAALFAGLLCMAVWRSRKKHVTLKSMVVWGISTLSLPLLWGWLVSWMARVPTTAQVTFPYQSPFSPWSGHEWGAHLTKILQTLVEPFQDAPMGTLEWGSIVPLAILLGLFLSQPFQRFRGVGVSVLFIAGVALASLQLTTEKVFFAGILTACPALGVTPFLRRRPQTKTLIWAWALGLFLLAVIAPNNGGLQRGCRYLLLPCVFGVFLVLSEWLRMNRAWKWTVGVILLLGLAIQIQGVTVLWNHKESKEVALERMVESKPDFVLTSVWYFPQEAGRIYSKVPILWARTDPQVHAILMQTESIQPKPDFFLAVLPAASANEGNFHLPNWDANRNGEFGGLPIFEFHRTGSTN
ncbi:MAG: hypothetical protein H6751_04555 [Candidatus Omnitrophica bacterium]|nr:hypothetical protein [Candidatus Omnitrophota bacterium]